MNATSPPAVPHHLLHPECSPSQPHQPHQQACLHTTAHMTHSTQDTQHKVSQQRGWVYLNQPLPRSLATVAHEGVLCCAVLCICQPLNLSNLLPASSQLCAPKTFPPPFRHLSLSPAVFDMPIKTPAYFGAMSMWLTLNPPLLNPRVPMVRVVARTPLNMPLASGMLNRAAMAATMPVHDQEGVVGRWMGGGVGVACCVSGGCGGGVEGGVCMLGVGQLHPNRDRESNIKLSHKPQQQQQQHQQCATTHPVC